MLWKLNADLKGEDAPPTWRGSRLFVQDRPRPTLLRIQGPRPPAPKSWAAVSAAPPPPGIRLPSIEMEGWGRSSAPPRAWRATPAARSPSSPDQERCSRRASARSLSTHPAGGSAERWIGPAEVSPNRASPPTRWSPPAIAGRLDTSPASPASGENRRRADQPFGDIETPSLALRDQAPGAGRCSRKMPVPHLEKASHLSRSDSKRRSTPGPPTLRPQDHLPLSQGHGVLALASGSRLLRRCRASSPIPSSPPNRCPVGSQCRPRRAARPVRGRGRAVRPRAPCCNHARKDEGVRRSFRLRITATPPSQPGSLPLRQASSQRHRNTASKTTDDIVGLSFSNDPATAPTAARPPVGEGTSLAAAVPRAYGMREAWRW